MTSKVYLERVDKTDRSARSFTVDNSSPHRPKSHEDGRNKEKESCSLRRTSTGRSKTQLKTLKHSYFKGLLKTLYNISYKKPDTF